MLDLVLQLLDSSFKICNLDSLLIDRFIQLAFSLLVLSLKVSDVFVELIDLLIKLVPFSMPFTCLTLLPFKPTAMLSLCVIEVFFKFVDGSLMEPSHLLNLQVQVFDFLVLIVDCVLKVSFFVHQLLHV